jgi:hypothetical protein
MDGRPSLLDDYKPYVHQRWNQGCTNVRRLHAELRDRSYRGGYGTIRDYVPPFRDLSSQYGDSSHPPSRMRAVSGVSDLALHLWAIPGSNQ